MSKLLRLYGEVGSGDCSATSFIAAMDAVPASQPLFIAINSGGGSYFDGLAIYTAIVRRGNVVALVDGLAASAASLIAMGARKIQMAPGSHLMIHSPLTTAHGNPAQLESTLSTLKKIELEMATVYSKRAYSMSVEDALVLMRGESWLDCEMAAQIFRNVEVDETKVAATIDPGWLDQYRNVPLALSIARRLKETTPAAPAKPAAEQDADRDRLRRRRRRLILMQKARSVDPAAAALQRRRHRLQLGQQLREIKTADENRRGAERARVAAERDLAERAQARAAKEDAYYRNWSHVPPRSGR